MARIATGAGDEGDTGLADGKRVRKSSARITAYGAVDVLCDWNGTVDWDVLQ